MHCYEADLAASRVLTQGFLCAELFHSCLYTSIIQQPALAALLECCVRMIGDRNSAHRTLLWFLRVLQANIRCIKQESRYLLYQHHCRARTPPRPCGVTPHLAWQQHSHSHAAQQLHCINERCLAVHGRLNRQVMRRWRVCKHSSAVAS
jgi:hypothetical protein